MMDVIILDGYYPLYNVNINCGSNTHLNISCVNSFASNNIVATFTSGCSYTFTNSASRFINKTKKLQNVTNILTPGGDKVICPPPYTQRSMLHKKRKCKVLVLTQM